jgi:hypothetical protein
VFKNDEEIQLTLDFLKMRLLKKEPILASADRLRDEQMLVIVGKLEKMGIPWKKTVTAAPLKVGDLKIALISGPQIKAGVENKLTFRATYPGAVENLDAALDTDIPLLRNLEIPFGSFTGSIERTVPVTIPEHMPWRRQPIRVDLSVDNFRTVAKSEHIEMESLPLDPPQVFFSLLAEDTVGSLNGLVEESEQITAHIALKNVGAGSILDGRLQLINVNNSSELFISKGTEPVILKPGEEKEFTFTFKISAPPADKRRIGIAVSLYDYKTKYSAGFSIPFADRNFACRYEERDKGPITLATGVKIYPDIQFKAPVAIVATPITLQRTGRCGEDAVRLEGGSWVHAADLRSDQPSPAVKGTLARQYNIAMPTIAMDRAPLTSASPDGRVSFTVAGDDVQDIFVFQNNKKIFYYRISTGEAKRDFAVPFILREKTNKITVVVKGIDRERINSLSRYIYFPAGNDGDQAEERDE